MNRQEYNKKIINHLKEDEFFIKLLEKYLDRDDEILGDEVEDFFNYTNKLIDKYPQQRFGQLFCNYIGGDYRTPEPEPLTIELQQYLFAPGNYDPFYEESHYTYYRLTGEIPEDIKKELDEKKGKKVYFKLDNGSTGIGVLSGVCVSLWSDEWSWKIDDTKLISTDIHLKLL